MTAPSGTTPPARFPWGPILVLGFAWFLGVAIELSPAGLLGDISRDLNISLATAGTLTTFYALGNAILVLPLTALVLRFARRPVLVTVMGTLVLSNVIVAVAPSIVVADIGRFIGGASYAVICTLFPAVAIRMAGPGNAGKAITVVFTATSLGTAFGAPIASITGNSVGWRLVFLGAAALVLVAGAAMAFTIPTFRDSPHGTVPFLSAIRLPGVFRVALAWALVMLSHFVVLTYIDAYLLELGAPEALTSITLLIIGVGGIVGTLFVGQVSRRSVFAAILIAPAVVASGFIVLIVGGRSIVVVLVGVIIWGVGVAAVVVIFQQALLLTGRRAPETATSVGVLLAQAGFAAGATVGGITLETLGIRAVPMVALAFVIIAAILALSLRPTIRRAQSDEAHETGNAPTRLATAH
ncbi:MFS transporter [Curtobacterium sp. YR515]|uniref:MFS transporter n=1 Tax=Curtobacterium sp. YR515 TaxID=1855316 RepID=UPI0008ECE8EE|nr:MFS transporter [Curtobacterium sp. YR515]SFF73880.1 Predicted arabinose efflux permease, MFS family [Curtobacterium sp. YR515]